MQPELNEPRNVDELKFATLTVSEHAFCVEISQIRETRRWAPVTTLPHSPSYVLGAMNLRGVIIPIIDLSNKLGYGPCNPSDRHVVLIIEVGNQTLGLLADSVQEILNSSSSQVHTPPSISGNPSSSCIKGLLSSGERMIRILDISKLVETVEEAA